MVICVQAVSFGNVMHFYIYAMEKENAHIRKLCKVATVSLPLKLRFLW